MKTLKQNILILLTLLVILPHSLHAQESEGPKTFTYEYEGQTLTYEVIEESAKTCRTKPGAYRKNPGNTAIDELKLPAKPIYDETEYTLVEISEYSFWNCASLLSIEIPESVQTIEEGAFDSCTGLKNIIIPTSVTNIGIYAFNGCSGLNSISLPSTLTTIGGVAFSDCTSLSIIIIPESVTSIGEDAFSGCPAFVTYNAKNCAINFPQNTAETQKASPFANITSLTIGNAVETIPDYAFKNCTNLVSINIESATSLTTIGNEAFWGCQSLPQMTIPESVTSIGSDSFRGCNALTDVTYKARNCNITLCDGASPFINATSLTIGDKVEIIPDDAFNSCNIALVNMESATSLASIGKQAFYRCNNLQSIDIPKSVTSIGEAAFSACDKLGGVISLGSITTISNNLFNGFCRSTDIDKLEIVIPSTVTAIGESAFESCISLTEIDIPESVTSIGNKAFSSCYNLTNINLGSSVKEIGNSAFFACKRVETLNIPSSVESIGSSAFSECTNLTSIYSLNTVPPSISDDSFSECEALSTAIVPNVSLDQYKQKWASLGESKIIPSVVLSVSPETLTLNKGDSQTITPTVTPASGITTKAQSWSSSNPTIATVDNDGKVTALAGGEANISFKVTDNLGIETSAICTATITVHVTGITLDKTELNLTEGETAALTATVTPTDATNKAITWKSDNEAAATVSADGKITAKTAGTANITAASAENSEITASCTVTVAAKVIAAESITLSNTVLSLTEGETATLTATVNPDNATGKAVSWSSNNTSVATVDANGKVTAKTAGTATITVTSAENSDISASCTVTVIAKTIPVEGIALDNTVLSLTEGETATLTATINPDNATDKSVSWSSDNTSVATVDAYGKVTAISAGGATITATSSNGLTATCTVIVAAKVIYVESITLSNSVLCLTEGESATLTVTIAPENATDKSVEWTSSDTSVATVDANGNVTVLEEGTCVITVSTLDGSSLSAQCTITGVSGIDMIFSDPDAQADVYNMNGTLVKRGCSRSDLKQLSPGIYILRQTSGASTVYIHRNH